jgi:hypothetical protein
MIVPIAVGAGIGCILLAGLLIGWFAMRSRRSSPADLPSPIVAESSVAVEDAHAGEEPPLFRARRLGTRRGDAGLGQ